eukprot:CAMPEP_0180426970 /NCGR_PEP_ID=MMETSP1036_2-20121128/6073_1 /TAXON_ID=632150 /ORGANISM="Azadinium spinosum, Strain 3D9" /LENGTH=519 /DNA_ID=CAMNT_0022432547 /DNA_START=1 /DNA_END=1557 /DNA_ORIENTATION=+
MMPKIMDYMRGSADDTEPVVKLADPVEIAAAFDSVAGVSLAIDDQQAVVDSEALLKAVEVVSSFSVRTSSPGFNNQLYGAVDFVGVAGDWLATALNANVHTYEAGPVFTLLERAVVAKVAGVVGGGFVEVLGGEEKTAEGLLLAGGSMANLYGMQLARHWKAPETKAGGNAAAPLPLLAFCSAEAHYSYVKAANLMGLGTDNLVKVPCDPLTGAMDVQALDELLTTEMAVGKRLPFFVGATAGSTVLGAFDPFKDIADLCAKHRVWMHVDGAWGGAVLFSRNQRHLADGVERADSFCWNPHKTLGAPLQNTVFVTQIKHCGLLRSANSANAAYLFQPDKNFGEFDLGDLTLQCGRRADALKLWMMWKALGDKGVERRVDWNTHLTKYMAKQLKARKDAKGRRCFMVTCKPQFANLCFYTIPPSLREAVAPGLESSPDPAEADDHALLKDEQVLALGKVSTIVKDRMQRQGKALVGFQPVRTSGRVLSNCWRMVVAGNREETFSEAYIDQILQDMLDLSE